MLSNNIVTSQSKVVQEYKYQEDKNVESIEDIGERIDAAAKALASIGQIDVISEETVKSSSINDEIYKKKEIKPKLVVASFDTNYKKDKGGNHNMVLMYDNGNNIKFSKDDNPVIVIKNDAVENVGGFNKFCLEIEKWCEQKTNESKKQQMSHPVSKQKECKQKTDESKKYYFEDYLKDHGFIKEQKEEKIDISKKLDEIMSLLIDESSLEM